ncbi:MFS transporter [Arthrobacter sp.]|uniref:MFS transporter n=1 Tax=Arthrobacter sp. TaxID=1667 RepID=UPI002588ABA4|nr:MFS transporter [Arthrobacter sp.]
MTLRRKFWVLTGLRWLPTGMLIPIYALLPLERGLSIAELGAVVAVQGIVVLFLELPTGGFADSLGRKPLLVASSVFALASYGVFAFAHSLGWFMAASALAGVFRALDSGPLNAWYVDETIAAGEGETVAAGISGAGTVIGLAIAGGAVLGGGLVAWHPVAAFDALGTPYLAAAALTLSQITLTTLLMHEDRSARAGKLLASIRQTPRGILDGARIVAGNRALRALLAVGLFFGFGMVGFEQFMPIRLSELLGSADLAGTMMGPVSAAAWGISAAGAAAVPLLLRRWSMPAVSMVLVASQGAMVVVMGLVAGPLGLVAAFFATYAVHSAFGAVYETLLHGEVDAGHRATVLSLASMVLQPAGSLGAVVLGLLATGVSTGAALVVAGIVLALAAPLFLVRSRPSAGTGQGAELVGGRLDTAGASGGNAPDLRERPVGMPRTCGSVRTGRPGPADQPAIAFDSATRIRFSETE